jgi:chitinase
VPAGIVATYTMTQDWGSGFQGQIRLDNDQSTSVQNWRLEFDSAANLTSIWDATIASHTGNHYVVNNAGWNSTLAAGGSVSFGFVGSPGNNPPPPINYSINGVPLGGNPPPGMPSLSVADVSVVEGNSGTVNATFTVRLSAASSSTVTVDYATANGTATAGSDYVAVSGRLSFAAEETQKTVSVPVQGDTQVEPDETFFLNLSNPVGATLATSQATGTIHNDDTSSTGDITFQDLSDWGSGFTGQITIHNSQATALSNWTLDFDFAGQITSIWDASVVSHAGSSYIVKNAGYNSSIPAGGTVTFGFNGSPGNVTVGPTNFVLHSTSATVVPAATAPWPAHVFAPYVDMTLYPMYDLAAAARNEGLKYFTLAFITADPAGRPSWGGYSTYGVNGGDFDVQVRSQIAALRALGGDVSVSFGGAAGQELAQVLTDATALKNAYRTVVDTYNLTRIDFDIEGAAVADRASIDRRSQALAALQQERAAAGKSLQVWLTLPVLPTGLTADGLFVVQSALAHGLVIAGVNIMAMDYGNAAAPNPQGHMGDYAIQAANSVFNQLRGQFGTSRTDAQLWQMIGVTPMIGLNDITTEVFDQQEARELLTFARQNGLGLLSMWSLNRDRQNAAGRINYVEITSSSILQSPLEFSLLFNTITG